MKSKLFKLIVISTIFIGVGFFIYFNYFQATDELRPVYIAKGDIEVVVVATGTVRPENRVEIKPPIAGRIEEVLVNEGDVLERGDVLAWMSSNDRAALLDAARSQGAEELKRWEGIYRPTPIIAPVSGTIIRRNVESGQAFGGSGEPILVMSDRLIVRANVDETDIRQIYNGQDVTVLLDAFPGEPLSANVFRISHEAQTVSSVTTYAIDIALEDDSIDYLRSGMTANVSFVLDERRDVVIIHRTHIVRDSQSGGTYVRVPSLNRREDYVLQPIELGLSDGLHFEVVSGLNEGDTILVSRFHGPSPGASPSRVPRGSGRRGN